MPQPKYQGEPLNPPGSKEKETMRTYKFPIVIKAGLSIITYTNSDVGTYANGAPCMSSLDDMLFRVDKGGATLISEGGKPASREVRHSKPEECEIERMPLSAVIIGVYQEGELIDFPFRANRIEVHGDIITLLASHRNSDNGFTAEVSFKRGTTVRYQVGALS